jgi:hypothetical protein
VFGLQLLLYQRGNNIEAVAPLIIDYKKEPITAFLPLRVIGSESVRMAL